MAHFNSYLTTRDAFDQEAQKESGMFSKDLTECDRLAIDYLNKLTTYDMRVLEIGAGMGNVIESLVCLDKTALDLSEKMLDKCSISNKVCGNMDELPFKDKSFDLVYMIMTFQHSKDPEKTLSEMERVCKGRLIIIDGDKDSIIGQDRERQIEKGTWEMCGDACWLSSKEFKDFEIGHIAPHILVLEKKV